MDLNDIIFHLGEDFPGDYGPGAPAIHQTSNFVFKDVSSMRSALEKEDEIPFYTRGTNPTIKLLATKIAALEGTEDALMFGSGSAAIASAVLSQIKSGDHIICIDQPYSWTKKLITQWLPRFGVSHSFFTSEDEIESLIQDNTQLIYLESPNSWTFELQDLERVSTLATKHGIVSILDNSYASPLLQQPAAHGIDLVVHAATKYLGGHSDVVAGVVCGSKTKIKPLFNGEYMTLGGVLSPFDAWLLIRSLRTLPLRMKEIGRTTEKVLEFLKDQAKVSQIYFPQHSLRDKTLSEKYLNGPSGLFTIDLNTTDIEKVESFCNKLSKFKLGPSWGSYGSLAFPAITTISSMNYDNPAVVIGRIRFSVGLEDSNTLIKDLKSALEVL